MKASSGPLLEAFLGAIQGATDGQAAALEDVGVDHSRFHVFVSEEFLDGADVVAVFLEEQQGAEGLTSTGSVQA
jgi:hypothetical protein